MDNFFSVPRPPKSPSLGFPDTIGHALLTDAHNRWRYSPGAAALMLEPGMLGVVPAEGAGGRHSRGHEACAASAPLTAESAVNAVGPFHFSYVKMKILFRFLWVSEKRL